MATFYLLPPRPLLAEYFAAHAASLFPGLAWAPGDWEDMAETLGLLAARRPDVFVVYREDLSSETSSEQDLADGFGAEPGDEVVEVRPSGRPGEWAGRRWQVGGMEKRGF